MRKVLKYTPYWFVLCVAIALGISLLLMHFNTRLPPAGSMMLGMVAGLIGAQLDINRWLAST